MVGRGQIPKPSDPMKKLLTLTLAVLALGTVGTFVKIFGVTFLSLWAITTGNVALNAIAIGLVYLSIRFIHATLK